MRFVYVIRNLINEKVYVGQTKNVLKRKGKHFWNARQGIERPLYRSIRKHGEENFSFEVLEECADDVINEREQHWVAHFDSFNPEKGFNLTNGGNQNWNVSDETKRRISRANQGKIPWNKGKHATLEHRKNLSLSHKGKQAPWNSRKRTDAEKENLRKKCTGRKHTLEEIQRQIMAQTGKKFSEERKQKLRVPKSENARLNMKIAQQKRRKIEGIR